MSKAFTKESDSSPGNEPESGDSGEPAVPKGTKNYITPAGFERLKKELKQLLTIDRPEVVRTVQWAAGNGDRSENGDYIYGKRRLREIDRRIRFLSKRLESMQVVDPTQKNSDRVLFGATVTVRDEEEREKAYRIVGIDETDVRNGSISWISPLAKVLLNAKVGDVVTLRTPKGPVDGTELEIVSIRYEEPSR